MASRDLRVHVIGDATSLERALGRASKSATVFGATVDTNVAKADKGLRNLRGLATGSAAGFGGAVLFNEVLGALTKSVDIASNLNEQMSKSNVVFRESAGVISEWSRGASTSIGIARDEALAAAATFGTMFDQAGRGAAESAELSKAVVQLAADLASFNNTNVEDALLALRSGLSGEIEPLRRFQVFLTEAAVAQEAMAESGKKSARELTQGEKIMARWSLILRQTTKQQGDFARTSQGLANQQRLLSAQVRDLQANLGQLLLPVITDVTTGLVAATGAALQLGDALDKLSKIRLPPIEIPIVGRIGEPGDTVGGLAGDVLRGVAENVPNLGPIVRAFRIAAGLQLDRDAKASVPELADDFRESLSAMVGEAFSEAVTGIKITAPRVNPADFAKQPGVDFEFDKAITGAVDAMFAGANKALDEAIAKTKEGLRTAEAEKAAEDRRKAFAVFVEKLELGVDRATLTATLRDDLAALQALKAGLERQVRSGVDVASAQRQLVQVTRSIAETREQIAANLEQASRTTLQARQFRALGLSATGGELIPTVENLRKQLDSLSQRVLGSDVPAKLVNRLAGVRKLLAGEFGKVTEESRRAIQELFRTIRGEFDKGARGPLTKTTALNFNKLFGDLSLGRDLERELRARLSGFNSAGLALDGLTRPGRTTGVGAISQPIVVNATVVSELDGQVIAKSTTRAQVKTARGTRQKRGPNRRSGI